MVTKVNKVESFAYPCYEYMGLSTDQKPDDVLINSIFWELDTGNRYYFSNAQWNPAVGGDDSSSSGGGSSITVPYATYGVTEVAGRPEVTQTSVYNFTALPKAMFKERTKLETVTFTGSPALASIDAYVFYGCTSLVLTALPTSVTHLSEFAFGGCTALTDLTIHAQMQSIENSAFYGCTNLKTVRFQGTPTLAKSIFGGCTKLTDIYVPWAQGAVEGAPWGAPNATIHYDWKG